jgi:hypothetical protein
MALALLGRLYAPLPLDPTRAHDIFSSMYIDNDMLIIYIVQCNISKGGTQ